MGEARRRGTKEERASAAIAERHRVDAERQRQRDEAERIQQERAAERWRAMTPEQRETQLEQAKAMAELYGRILHARRGRIVR